MQNECFTEIENRDNCGSVSSNGCFGVGWVFQCAHTETPIEVHTVGDTIAGTWRRDKPLRVYYMGRSCRDGTQADAHEADWLFPSCL